MENNIYSQGASKEETKEKEGIEAVRAERNRPINVDLDFKFPEINVQAVDRACRKYRCVMCGNTYPVQKGNFPVGGTTFLWRGNNGYLPFCKDCVAILMDSLTRFYSGNEEHALRHLCCMFGLYYCDSASSQTKNQVRVGKSRAVLYPAKTMMTGVARRGEHFTDTLKDEQRARDALAYAEVGTDASSEDEDAFVITREMIRKWGRGYSEFEYEFLESEYDDWCDKTEVKSKAQEELIRAICIAQLNVRNAQMNGGKVDAAMKTLTDLMANCNLTPRQNSELSNMSETQMSYGQFIKRIENEMPIGEPQEEFKDPDGIRKYIGTFFFGHLAKALGIKNDNEKEYEEEMNKYAVKYLGEEKQINADEVFGTGSPPEEGVEGDGEI